MPDNPKTADLILSGGGVKFIGLVGAIVKLMEDGYSFQRVSGVSAGSVVAAIVAAASKDDQLTSEEVKELGLSVPLRKWRDAGPIPLVGPVVGLLRDTGLYRGDFAHDWIRSELKNLGVNKFGDLAIDDDNLLEERRYRAVVTVADLTTAQLIRLPWDYRRVYGLDPDEQSVADAVRASMAIPFIYRPVTLRSASGVDSTLVDGGLLSTFPIDSLDRPDAKPPRWPTFGITVVPKLFEGIESAIPALRPLRRLGPPSLLEKLILTMVLGHDLTRLNEPWVSARAIRVVSTEVGVLDFGISRERLEEQYDRGYAAAEAFLSTWDFPAYLKRFRRYQGV
jgi:NTE family protein